MNLVFLDFDGVLHSDEVWFDRATNQPQLRAPGQLFESAHLFEEAIAPYSSLLVILSTSWVRACGFEQARAFLPESLQRRVIGATYDPQSPDAWRFDRLTRYDAIAQDVKRRKPSRWLAVDDDPLGSWPENERAALALTPPSLGLACPVAYAQLQDRLGRSLRIAITRWPGQSTTGGLRGWHTNHPVIRPLRSIATISAMAISIAIARICEFSI